MEKLEKFFEEIFILFVEDIISIYDHRAEFVHRKWLAISAYAFMSINDRAR